MREDEILTTLSGGGRRRRREEDEARPSPSDVLCITLREVAARYTAPCPYKPGDLVTPRSGCNMMGAGRPQIVVEVNGDAAGNFAAAKEPSDLGSALHGRRPQVRVVAEMEGDLCMFWVEHWTLEPYTGPDAGRDAA